ncbi:ATP-binding protein [bacterium]|nr:ATP-binding protein [bacterium]
MSDLKISVSRDVPPTVKLRGQVDFHNRDRMSEAFERCLKAGHRTIRADLSEVRYIDSSALSTLIRCAAKAMEMGASVELTGASDQVSRVLTLCGAAVYFSSLVEDVPVCGGQGSACVDHGFWRVSSFSVPACPETAAMARCRVEEVVRSMPFTRSEAQDILIAVGEAIANAIRHGCLCNPEHRIAIKCVAGSRRLSIDVTDPGAGFLPDVVPDHRPDSMVEGGMGIYMMRQLVDEVLFRFDGSTTVRLVKCVNTVTDPVAVN